MLSELTIIAPDQKMNHQYTLGPWNYTVSDHDHTHCEHAYDIVSDHRPFVATVLGGADPGRSESNARLIAAAPDLLATLNALVRRIDDYGCVSACQHDDRAWLSPARDAIAKALRDQAT